MKKWIAVFLMIPAYFVSGQSGFPKFLDGTWKSDSGEIYEHWNLLNNKTMKGFSYKMKNGELIVSEYLDISGTGDDVIYTATVINQNQGRGIDFKLIKSDSVYIFENPNHDFPKRIVYKKLSESDMLVQVSDGNQKSFEYIMKKQHTGLTLADSAITNPDYDMALAKKLGADDYGMKSYMLVILKTGTNQTTDKAFISESFRGHMENINRLVEQKKLIVAGPLGKNANNYRGIFILNNVAGFDEANEILQTDPAIKSGLLDVELYNWYGSAALPEYLPFSEKVWKVKP
jgi:uncharacterized protein YciI